MRQYKRFSATAKTTMQLALWAERADVGYCFRGSGWGAAFHDGFDAFAGVGIAASFEGKWSEAPAFVEAQRDTVFVQLAYDLKDSLENLGSRHRETNDFPLACFFVPLWTITIREEEAIIGWLPDQATENDADALWNEVCQLLPPPKSHVPVPPPSADMPREVYLQRFQTLADHIQRGDVYQVNLCHSFRWHHQLNSPAAFFHEAYERMPNPFSVFYKYGTSSCMSFSPERFVSVADGVVTSQPMKGTAPRSADPEEDHRHYQSLRHSEKDRRENVMIVDMVRNDLSHYALPGSVKVPELYQIEAYPRVHQMYSTVIARLKPEVPALQAILRAFPMGSMTGAPKVRAMQIIDELENHRRGLYSGSLGFFTPEGRCDMNVVIRTLFYDSVHHRLHCTVGGGVTALSDAEVEYQETLLKVEPITQLLAELG